MRRGKLGRLLWPSGDHLPIKLATEWLEDRTLLSIGTPALVGQFADDAANENSTAVPVTETVPAGETLIVLVATDANATDPMAAVPSVSDAGATGSVTVPDAMTSDASMNATVRLFVFSQRLTSPLTFSADPMANASVLINIPAGVQAKAISLIAVAGLLDPSPADSNVSNTKMGGSSISANVASQGSVPAGDLVLGAFAVGSNDMISADTSGSNLSGTFSGVSTNPDPSNPGVSLFPDYQVISSSKDQTAAAMLASKSSYAAAIVAYQPQPPLASNHSYTVNAGSTLNPTDLLSGDTLFGVNPTVTTALVGGNPPGASSGFMVNSDGSFVYTPKTATSTDSFQYKILDGVLSSAPSTVTITVDDVAPTISPSSTLSTRENLPIGTAGDAGMGRIVITDSDAQEQGTPNYYKITSLMGGTLELSDGSSLNPPSGQSDFYITPTQASAGLIFVPTPGKYSNDPGSDTFGFNVAASPTEMDGMTTDVGSSSMVSISVTPPDQPTVTGTLATRAFQPTGTIQVAPSAGDSSSGYVTNIDVTAVVGGSLSYTLDGGGTQTIGAGTYPNHPSAESLTLTEAGTLVFTPDTSANALASDVTASGRYSFTVDAAAVVTGVGAAYSAPETITVAPVTPPSAPSLASPISARLGQSTGAITLQTASGDSGYVNGFVFESIAGGSLQDTIGGMTSTLAANTFYPLSDFATPNALTFLTSASGGSASFVAYSAFEPSGSTHDVNSKSVVNSVTSGGLTVSVGVTGPYQPLVPTVLPTRAGVPTTALDIAPDPRDSGYVTQIDVTAMSGGSLSFTPDVGDNRTGTITSTTLQTTNPFTLSLAEAATLTFTSNPALNTASLVRAGTYSFTVEAAASQGTVFSTPVTTLVSVIPPFAPTLAAPVATTETATSGTIVIAPDSRDSGYVTQIDVTALSQGTLTYIPDPTDSRSNTISSATLQTTNPYPLSPTEAATLVFTPTATYDLNGADSARKGNYSFTVESAATISGGTVVSDPLTVPVTVTPSADLKLSIQQPPAMLQSGQTFSYFITVTNAGPSTADAIMLSDPLPSGLQANGTPTLSTAYPSPKFSTVGSVSTFTLGPNSTATLTIPVKVLTTASGGTLQNVVTITSLSDAVNVDASNSASVTSQVSASLTVTNNSDNPTLFGSLPFVINQANLTFNDESAHRLDQLRLRCLDDRVDRTPARDHKTRVDHRRANRAGFGGRSPGRKRLLGRIALDPRPRDKWLDHPDDRVHDEGEHGDRDLGRDRRPDPRRRD